MSTVLAVLSLIADAAPGMSVSQALSLAHRIDGVYPDQALPFDWSRGTVQERAAVTRTLPEVMKHLPSRKIEAIKALRVHAAPALGLKEAKDVIDLIQPMAG